MADATDAGAENATEAGDDAQHQEQTFTQADIDRLVSKARGEERRKASERFADYDELKTKAAGAKTLEQQFADLKNELSSTKAEALRARIAADHNISTKKGPNGEPSDADLFLTGSDEETLTAQASRLSAREADRKKHGNIAPREGVTTNTGDSKTAESLNFLSRLTGAE